MGDGASLDADESAGSDGVEATTVLLVDAVNALDGIKLEVEPHASKRHGMERAAHNSSLHQKKHEVSRHAVVGCHSAVLQMDSVELVDNLLRDDDFLETVVAIMVDGNGKLEDIVDVGETEIAHLGRDLSY